MQVVSDLSLAAHRFSVLGDSGSKTTLLNDGCTSEIYFKVMNEVVAVEMLTIT